MGGNVRLQTLEPALDLQREPAVLLADVPRPVRMPGFLRYVALGIGVVILFVCIYGDTIPRTAR
jgi:hypothetical protein